MCFFAKPLNHSKAEGDLNIIEMGNLHNKRAINHEKQLGLYHNKVTSSQNPIQGFYDKKKTENGPHTKLVSKQSMGTYSFVEFVQVCSFSNIIQNLKDNAL